jgi:hypothetical protein
MWILSTNLARAEVLIFEKMVRAEEDIQTKEG